MKALKLTNHLLVLATLYLPVADLAANVAETPTENCQPCAQLSSAENKYAFKGVHLGLLGGFGLSNANATFSTFPGGTGVDFRTTADVAANLTYYWENSRGISLGIGNAIRNIAFKDSSGSGNYAMNFVDLRSGYRAQANALLVEMGVFYALKTQNVPVTISTSGLTASGFVSGVNQNSFFGVYVMLGIHYPFSRSVFGLFVARMDYGLSAAISGNWPVSATASQSIALVPFNLGGSIGVGFKL